MASQEPNRGRVNPPSPPIESPPAATLRALGRAVDLLSILSTTAWHLTERYGEVVGDDLAAAAEEVVHGEIDLTHELPHLTARVAAYTARAAHNLKVADVLTLAIVQGATHAQLRHLVDELHREREDLP